MEYRVDILIVGAGIAGLRCGIELLNQNPKKTVLILEKYNYSGGRVVTYSTEVDSKKYQWENGAGRISDTHLKVHDLLNKYGLETIPLSKTQLWIPTSDAKPEENPFDATMEVMLPKTPAKSSGNPHVDGTLGQTPGPLQSEGTL